MLNSYITIFSTTKYQNMPYNGRAKTIYFLALQLLLTVHCSWKVKKKKMKKNYLYVHTTFDYFTHFFSFFYSYFSSSARLHYYCLCVHTSFTFFFFLFLYSIHMIIYCLYVHTTIVLLFFYFFFPYKLFFYLCVHIAIVVDILFYCVKN